MSDQKNNDPNGPRPSLWEFLKSSQIKQERIIFIAGFLVMVVSLIFVNNSTASLIATVFGAVMTFAATDQIMKKMPK